MPLVSLLQKTGLNIVYQSLNHIGEKHYTRRNVLLKVHTFTRESLSLDGFIHLHLHLSDLRAAVCCSITPNLSVNMLLVATYIDLFIRGCSAA